VTDDSSAKYTAIGLSGARRAQVLVELRAQAGVERRRLQFDSRTRYCLSPVRA